MKGYLGGFLIGLGLYLGYQDYKDIKAKQNWKEATGNERTSGQETIEPARISGSSNRDNGTGASDLCI